MNSQYIWSRLEYAASVGVSTAISSNLMGIHSAVSSVGRFAVGYIGDKIGRINAFMIATTIAGLSCFLLWPFATTYSSLLCFVIVWGSVSHTYYSLVWYQDPMLFLLLTLVFAACLP